MWIMFLFGLMLVWWLAIFLIIKLLKLLAVRFMWRQTSKPNSATSAREQRLSKLPIRMFIFTLALLPLADELVKAMIRVPVYELYGGLEVFEKKTRKSFWVNGHSENWILFNKSNVSGVIVDSFFDYQPTNPENILRMSLRKNTQKCAGQFGDFESRLTTRTRDYLVENEMCLHVEETSDKEFYTLEISDWVAAPEADYIFFQLLERRWIVRNDVTGKVISHYRQIGTVPGILLSWTPAAYNLVTSPIDINKLFPLENGQRSSLEDRVFSKLIDLAN